MATAESLDEKLVKQEIAIETVEKEAEEKFQATKDAAKGTSGVTKTKVEQRAKGELAAAKAVAKDLREDMDGERRARIEGELRAKRANSVWKDKAHENMENRQVGPLPVPRTLQECKALYNKFPTATPYEGAYLYLVRVLDSRVCPFKVAGRADVQV
eukprot:gene12095-2184_t